MYFRYFILVALTALSFNFIFHDFISVYAEEVVEETELAEETGQEFSVLGTLKEISAFLGNINDSIDSFTGFNIHNASFNLIDSFGEEWVDYYVLNVSTILNEPIYLEYRFQFLSMGFALAGALFIVSTLQAIYLGADNSFVIFKDSTIRFVLYIGTSVMFVIFTWAYLQIIDEIGYAFAQVTFGDEYSTQIDNYYDVKEDRFREAGKDTSHISTEREEAKNGELRSAVVLYTMKESIEIEDSGILTVLLVSILYFIGVVILIAYGILRQMFLAFMIIFAPIYFALPIVRGLNPPDPFRFVVKVGLQHLGILLGFYFSYLYLLLLGGGQSTLVGLFMPIIATVSIYVLAQMFGSVVSGAGLSYSAGIPYLGKLYQGTKHFGSGVGNLGGRVGRATKKGDWKEVLKSMPAGAKRDRLAEGFARNNPQTGRDIGRNINEYYSEATHWENTSALGTTTKPERNDQLFGEKKYHNPEAEKLLNEILKKAEENSEKLTKMSESKKEGNIEVVSKNSFNDPVEKRSRQKREISEINKKLEDNAYKSSLDNSDK